MKEKRDGLSILIVSTDTKPEDMPQEARDMVLLMDAILLNSARICEEKGMNITLLPSIYLNAFNKVIPLLAASIIKEAGEKEAQTFLDGLKTIIEGSFDLKKK